MLPRGAYKCRLRDGGIGRGRGKRPSNSQARVHLRGALVWGWVPHASLNWVHCCTCMSISLRCQHAIRAHAEFVGIMGRDIRDFDNESDLKMAWKVFDKVRRLTHGGKTSCACPRSACPLLVPFVCMLWSPDAAMLVCEFHQCQHPSTLVWFAWWQ